MSFTYSDFIYPQNAEGDNQLPSMSFVGGPFPNEIQVIQESAVPFLIQNSEDRNNCDFIIIAEFSELEGPVPLATIPAAVSAGNKDEIDLNALAVHLMSTDYQVNTVGHFSICEDTQVLRKNVFKDIHVFMQYFTLYDIKARGFVRPFCFGYVSKDHVKLERELNNLIVHFSQMTKVLKNANRTWFARELEDYLNKLKLAKEAFPIEDETETGIFQLEGSQEALEEDPDIITYSQIAHQHSEIGNILETVKTSIDTVHNVTLETVTSFIRKNEECSLSTLLAKMKIASSIEDQLLEPPLELPLVHPLKQKGETLRPLTTLGQLGTVFLVWRLMLVEAHVRVDILASEMTRLNLDLREYFENRREESLQQLEDSCSTVVSNKTEIPDTFPSLSRQLSNEESSMGLLACGCRKDEENVLLHTDMCSIIEKLHLAIPGASMVKSRSYSLMSEDGFVIDSKNVDADTNGEARSFKSAKEYNEFVVIDSDGSSDDRLNKESVVKMKEEISSPCLDQSSSFSNATESIYASRATSISSMSSEDDCSSILNAASQTMDLSSEEELIQKVSWWVSSTVKLTRGKPGYGLLSFFRRYAKVAHHVLYSVLLGRPLIICGPEAQKRRVNRILTALVPIVPCYPEKTWKLLRWHRGILVKGHHFQYKLIGLCIPERLEVHDLINSRDQNLVTIFHIEKKAILGPAYAGQWFQRFETVSGLPGVQAQFCDDASLLAYIGTILTDIETKVYMFKALKDNPEKKDGPIFKQLGLRASDCDIVRTLAQLTADTEFACDLF